jgi:hypothetical protein
MYDIFINMDRKEIADYLAKKVFNGELTEDNYYVMLKSKEIYSEGDYGELIESHKISPEDAFVYINFSNYGVKSYNDPVDYLFPLIDVFGANGIKRSYLAKLGFYNPNYYGFYPATGLKYYAIVRLFSDRVVIEIVDIDVVVTNIGLRKIVVNVLGIDLLTQKEIDIFEIDKIDRKLRVQKLFAGYTAAEAREIIFEYYIGHNTSLAKDVLAITNAYNRIFEPYRVVYDTSTRQQVLM